MSPDGGPGFRVEDRLSRLVAVGAVVATLLAGLVAFLLVWASNNANQAGLEADRLGIRAMGELTRAMSEAEADYQAFIMSQELRTQQGLAHQEHEVAEASERHGLARDRWGRLADDSLELLSDSANEMKPGGVYSPERDPSFPERFLAAQTGDAVRYAALQDAYNEKATLHGGKVSQYIAVMTMFGVALYLFALLSVSIQYDIRRLFATVGAALLLAGSVWTGITTLKRVPDVKEAAADAFAAGHVTLASAHNHARYVDAIGYLSQATKKRETFARAYFERATARLLAASLQSGVPVLSPGEALETAADPAVLKAVAADLQKAHDYGLVTAPVLGRLGLFSFLYGQLEHDPGMVERGMEYTDEAVAMDPTEPTWRFNHALTLLATGDHDDALNEYRRALCLTFVDVEALEEKRDRLREDPCRYAIQSGDLRLDAQVQVLKAEALSNLAVIARTVDTQAQPSLDRAIGMVVGSTAERIVTGTASGRQPVPLPVTVDPTGVSFEPGDRLATRPHLSVVTYYRHPVSGMAYVIPELSLAVSSPNTDVRLDMPTTKPFRCLPDGSYRVELYSNGDLIGRGMARANFGDVHQAAVAPDLDLRTCVPGGWRSYGGNLPGLIHGKENPSGPQRAFLLRFEAHPDRGNMSSHRFAEWAVGLLGGEARELTGPFPVRSGYFATLQQPMKLTYDVAGSVAEVWVGLEDVDADQSGVVAVVMGPRDWMASEQARTILKSVHPFYESIDNP